MTHYRQWSAAFGSYFTILGLWTAFGPGTLMATSPRAAPLALAAMTLAYFVATPCVRMLWQRLGFARTLALMGAGVGLSLACAALAPQWLAVCAPLAFFFGSGSYTLCETRLLEDLAHSGQGHRFGRARKWGSFGFLAAASLGGAVFSLGGVGPSFGLALGLCGLVYFGCCLALARAVAQAPNPVQIASAATAAAAAPAPLAIDSATKANGSGPTVSATDSPRQRWWGTCAISGLRLGETISTTWFGAYWLSTGHGPLQTGLLCALPVAAEFWALWRGAALLARFSTERLMLLCCVLSALRWWATPLCESLWCAVPLQAMHAFSFGLFYPASLIWLQAAFADNFFQARYLSESLTRALSAAVSFAAASWVILQWGHGALFALSGALAAAAALWWWRVARP